ncbi:hypothetical protein [Parahaliea aestuarii]|uniref:Uncharacterized protein n=1 Tax=Parahaliea aestuarii TaxID=1852021 RepID=A0A5C8ZMD0_9GAMM|nr:hypothetical protein [Parahaliea aestuarii]TXS88914.1 hypothetical protein FVW59_19385 [Parahaliea aestuarii]
MGYLTLSVTLGLAVLMLLAVKAADYFIESIPHDAIPIVASVCAAILLAFALFFYIGGWIVKGHKGAFRVGIVLSIVWIFAWLLASDPFDSYGWDEPEAFFLGGLLPTILFWGVVWIAKGFREAPDPS